MSEKPSASWLEDKEYAAMTLGVFLQVVIDGGGEDIVFAKIVEQVQLDEKSFRMKLEIELVPNGYVLDRMREIGFSRAHDILIKMFDKGIVK